MDIINKKSEDDNIGGLHKIILVPMSKLVAFPYIGLDGGFDAVFFETINPDFTANIIELEYKRQSASFEEDEVKQDLGKIYKQSITCTVAKDYAERSIVFNTLKHERFLVIVWDNNLLGKVIGFITKEGEKQGAELTIRKATGDLYTRLNMLSITLYCEGANRAFDIIDNSYFGIPPSTGAEPIPPPED